MFVLATELIDKKLTEIKEIDDKDYPSDNNTRRGSDFLRYLLGNKKLSVDEIYTNTTELLLSGVDTVCISYIGQRSNSHYLGIYTWFSSIYRAEARHSDTF